MSLLLTKTNTSLPLFILHHPLELGSFNQYLLLITSSVFPLTDVFPSAYSGVLCYPKKPQPLFLITTKPTLCFFISPTPLLLLLFSVTNSAKRIKDQSIGLTVHIQLSSSNGIWSAVKAELSAGTEDDNSRDVSDSGDTDFGDWLDV